MESGIQSNFPKGIRYLLIATIVVYIFQLIPYTEALLMEFGSLMPSQVVGKAQLWRLITYMFLHDSGNPLHILFNLLSLWMFGVEIENSWGTSRFVRFYFISGVGAGLFSLLMIFFGDTLIIGASGAVLALLTAYAWYYPDRKLLLFFLFPVPVRIAVIIFGAISLAFAFQSGGGIAHITHLGGIIVAIVYLKYYNTGISWYQHIRALKAEKTMRRYAARKINRDKYYEEVIDPILKKISEQGMASLTRDERKKLKRASEND